MPTSASQPTEESHLSALWNAAQAQIFWQLDTCNSHRQFRMNGWRSAFDVSSHAIMSIHIAPGPAL
jgi:hypothetical protein